MKISKLIELLESEMEREGDLEIYIYNDCGEKVEPKSIGIGNITGAVVGGRRPFVAGRVITRHRIEEGLQVIVIPLATGL